MLECMQHTCPYGDVQNSRKVHTFTKADPVEQYECIHNVAALHFKS